MRFRHENKYIINEHTAALLKARLAGVMQHDPHGKSYIVNNLYFDDRYDSFYNAKYLGRFVRDKYRLRFYNDDTSFIRLERKHKEGALSYKDTTNITVEQYMDFKNGDLGFLDTLGGDSDRLLQSLANIKRLKGLRPTAIYAYRREAYIYDAGNVRITFDSPPFQKKGEIIAPLTYEPRTANFGKQAYSPMLLEVKFSRFMPEIIKRLLNGLPLAHTEMSKYCIVREKGVLPYGEI